MMTDYVRIVSEFKEIVTKIVNEAFAHFEDGVSKAEAIEKIVAAHCSMERFTASLDAVASGTTAAPTSSTAAAAAPKPKKTTSKKTAAVAPVTTSSEVPVAECSGSLIDTEVVTAPEAAEEVPAVTPKRRGRPPKSATTPSAASAAAETAASSPSGEAASSKKQRKSKTSSAATTAAPGIQISDALAMLDDMETEITVCMRLLRKGEKNGLVCGEPAVNTSEAVQKTSYACASCLSFKTKNPLLNEIKETTSKPKLIRKTATASAGSSSAVSKKKAAAAASKEIAEEQEVAEEVAEEQEVAEEAVVPSVAPITIRAASGDDESSDDQASGGSSATLFDPSDKGLMMLPRFGRGIYRTKPEHSSGDHNILIVVRDFESGRLLIVGKISEEDYDDLVAKSLETSSPKNTFITSLEELETTEDALDVLIENGIVHYRFRNTGNISAFQDEE